MKATRRIRNMLRRAEALVAEQRRQAGGGVLAAANDAEFDRLAASLPRAGPREVGVLLVPRVLTPDEWLGRHKEQIKDNS
jgi:hypothetical protein